MATHKQPKRRPVSCDGCDALCCRYVATELDRPTGKRDYDHIRWYLLHRQVAVFIDHAGSWFLEFTTPCEALGARGECTRYATRPRICRDHGEGSAACEFHGPGAPHVERFTTPEAFERWLDAQRIDWRWRPRGRVPEAAVKTG
jgi:uncharacterized protein